MYYKEVVEIIELILSNQFVPGEKLLNYLISTFDCEKIYNSEDMLLTDVFFTLKHYASGEEEVDRTEWIYFLECLNQKRVYKMEEKLDYLMGDLR